jgi:hypothetical protein
MKSRLRGVIDADLISSEAEGAYHHALACIYPFPTDEAQKTTE